MIVEADLEKEGVLRFGCWLDTIQTVHDRELTVNVNVTTLKHTKRKHVTGFMDVMEGESLDFDQIEAMLSPGTTKEPISGGKYQEAQNPLEVDTIDVTV